MCVCVCEGGREQGSSTDSEVNTQLGEGDGKGLERGGRVYQYLGSELFRLLTRGAVNAPYLLITK